MGNRLFFPLLGMILFFMACNNRNAVVTDATVVETDSVQAEETVADRPTYYDGIVRDKSQTDGCGFMIELTGQKSLLEPGSLPDKYKVDGKAIRFSYTDSRRSTTCTLVPSRTITINDIAE